MVDPKLEVDVVRAIDWLTPSAVPALWLSVWALDWVWACEWVEDENADWDWLDDTMVWAGVVLAPQEAPLLSVVVVPPPSDVVLPYDAPCDHPEPSDPAYPKDLPALSWIPPPTPSIRAPAS